MENTEEADVTGTEPIAEEPPKRLQKQLSKKFFKKVLASGAPKSIAERMVYMNRKERRKLYATKYKKRMTLPLPTEPQENENDSRSSTGDEKQSDQ